MPSYACLNSPLLINLRIEEPSCFPVETAHHFVSSVEGMLAGVPRNLEFLSARFSSGAERFLAIVTILRPRRIAFADRFYGPDLGLSAFVKG
jgi:hypothetical protein